MNHIAPALILKLRSGRSFSDGSNSTPSPNNSSAMGILTADCTEAFSVRALFGRRCRAIASLQPIMVLWLVEVLSLSCSMIDSANGRTLEWWLKTFIPNSFVNLPSYSFHSWVNPDTMVWSRLGYPLVGKRE